MDILDQTHQNQRSFISPGAEYEENILMDFWWKLNEILCSRISVHGESSINVLIASVGNELFLLFPNTFMFSCMYVHIRELITEWRPWSQLQVFCLLTLGYWVPLGKWQDGRVENVALEWEWLGLNLGFTLLNCIILGTSLCASISLLQSWGGET